MIVSLWRYRSFILKNAASDIRYRWARFYGLAQLPTDIAWSPMS